VLNEVDLMVLDQNAVAGSQVLPFLPLTENSSGAQPAQPAGPSPDQTPLSPEPVTESE